MKKRDTSLLTGEIDIHIYSKNFLERLRNDK